LLIYAKDRYTDEPFQNKWLLFNCIIYSIV
jgi:hypothetical protein